jgi:hypothetical protein
LAFLASAAAIAYTDKLLQHAHAPEGH